MQKSKEKQFLQSDFHCAVGLTNFARLRGPLRGTLAVTLYCSFLVSRPGGIPINLIFSAIRKTDTVCTATSNLIHVLKALTSSNDFTN